jgi:hypothetical protein
VHPKTHIKTAAFTTKLITCISYEIANPITSTAATAAAPAPLTHKNSSAAMMRGNRKASGLPTTASPSLASPASSSALVSKQKRHLTSEQLREIVLNSRCVKEVLMLILNYNEFLIT